MARKRRAGLAVALASGMSVVSCGAGGSQAQSSLTKPTIAQPTITQPSMPLPSADHHVRPPSDSATRAPSWADVFEEVNSGVVRIAVTACGGGAGSGSGFLVGPDLVATASHVVENTTSLSVRAGAQVRAAEILGMEPDVDVAIVRLDRPIDGHVFDWASANAQVGDDIAAIGYPLGQPLAMTRGAVTALDRRIEVDGVDRRNLVQTDAAINPGNSGGPLITPNGDAAGIVSAGSDAPGDAYAVGRDAAREVLNAWAAENLGIPSMHCDLGEEREDSQRLIPLMVEVTSTHPEAPSMAQTFQRYGDAVNSGDYYTAYNLLTPSARASSGTLMGYSEKLASSYLTAIDIIDVAAVDATTDDVEVAITTEQDAGVGSAGQTCSQWWVSYRMVLDAGFWQIDRATRLAEPVACAEGRLVGGADPTG